MSPLIFSSWEYLFVYICIFSKILFVLQIGSQQQMATCNIVGNKERIHEKAVILQYSKNKVQIICKYFSFLGYHVYYISEEDSMFIPVL